MKTETIYKALYNYAKNLPEVKNLDETLKKWIITDPKKPGYGGASDIINLLANLQQDIRTAANKANGKGNIEKALNKIAKNANKTQLKLIATELETVCKRLDYILEGKY